MLLQLGYLAAVTVPLVVIDVRSLRLPNALVLPGLMLLAWGIAWAALAGLRSSASEASSPWAGLTGASVAGGLLLGAWMLGTVGMGDVKLGTWLGGLAGMTGMLSRPDGLAQGLVAGAALAGITVVVDSVASIGGAPLRTSCVPLGPALLAAFWIASVTGAVSVP